jgi:hypothetical protein
MFRTLTRTGIATVALAGAIIAGGGPLAQAQAAPMAHRSFSTVFTYYNNAQDSVVVGQIVRSPCGLGSSWGTTSAYFTYFSVACQT